MIFIYVTNVFAWVPRFFVWLRRVYVVPNVSLLTLIVTVFAISIVMSILLGDVFDGDDILDTSDTYYDSEGNEISEDEYNRHI